MWKASLSEHDDHGLADFQMACLRCAEDIGDRLNDIASALAWSDIKARIPLESARRSLKAATGVVR